MNPRIYIGALDEATYTMSLTENASFPLSNLSTYNPLDLWKSSAATNAQTLLIDFGAARWRDFCVIAGHNFSGMTTVLLQAATDSAYTSPVTIVSSLVGSNKDPLKFEFTAVNYRYWRILFTDCNSVTPQLGQIFIDQKVDFTQNYDWGLRPRNEDHESVTVRTALSGLSRSSKSYSGRMRYEFGWTNINNRTLENIRWWVNKVQGSFAPFYFYDHDDNQYYVKLDRSFNPASVKAFKINDAAGFVVEAQSAGTISYAEQTNPMAVVLDGSADYASKASPVNLDMNGAERIADSDDRTFESDAGNWTDEGNHVFSRTTSNPLVGTGSGLIAASGVGDRTTNYIELASSRFTTLEAGKKYTIELLANSDTATTTITLALGTAGQTAVSGTLSTTPGTGTKVVFNFLAASADVSVGLRIYASKAANVRIDSVSLTEAYDFTILHWFKSSYTGADQRIIRLRHASLAQGMLTQLQTTGVVIASLESDGVSAVNITSGAGNADGTWRLGVLSASRVGSGQWYINGVASSSAVSITSLGKIITFLTLHVGWNTAAAYFNGQIGETQIIRGYAMTAAQILQIYQTTGILKAYDATAFPNATVVAHYRWKGNSDTLFLKDETGYNNLTGTSIDQQGNQAIGTYRIAELD